MSATSSSASRSRKSPEAFRELATAIERAGAGSNPLLRTVRLVADVADGENFPMPQRSRFLREPSQRQLRVGELVRHALSSILEREGFRDPVLAQASVTVTEVRVSPDLAHATAFVVPLGGKQGPAVVAALRRAAPYLRRKLGDAVELRRIPALSFEADTSFDHAQRISELLRESGAGGSEGGGGSGDR